MPMTTNYGTVMKELLVDSTKWTKGAYARTANGDPCAYTDSNVSCFCLIGAMRHCKDKYDIPRPSQLTNTVDKYINEVLPSRKVNIYPAYASESTASFNDYPQTTFEHIKEFLDLLEKLEAEWIEKNFTVIKIVEEQDGIS